MKSDKQKTKKDKVKKPRRIGTTNVILWRSFSLFTVAVIALVAIVCYGILGNAFFSQTKKRLTAVGNEICAIVKDDKLPLGVKEARISNYALTDGVDVYLLDESGSTIIPYRFVTPEGWETVVGNMDNRVGEWEKDKTLVYTSQSGSVSTLNYVSCISYGGERCKVLVRYSLYALSASINQMQIYVVIIALAAIAFTFFVSYFVAEKLSRPMRNMSQTAKKMAGGDYDVQFTSMEYQEIADLSAALNYMKDEMRKSEDFQKELLANVSHDLKTPLTMIKAYASMIKEISGGDPEKRDKHLQVIIDESDRLTGLVNDVLNTSKLNAGLVQLNRKVFNITEYLYGVINKFDYLTETQGYCLMVDIDANLYTYADEEKTGQVIYNLISNAVNYTGEDKCVYIALKYSAEDNRIKFSVRDTGKGISQVELPHIWERYYRSKESHLRPIKGTGLGLNIVKAVLEAHSFAYGVTSNEGYGSTFYVDFPFVNG